MLLTVHRPFQLDSLQETLSKSKGAAATVPSAIGQIVAASAPSTFTAAWPLVLVAVQCDMLPLSAARGLLGNSHQFLSLLVFAGSY